MKMQNAEMVFVRFTGSDIITSSVSGNWFIMNAFEKFDTDKSWYVSPSSSAEFVIHLGDAVYEIRPFAEDGSPLGNLQLGTVYQLVDEPSNINMLLTDTELEDHPIYYAIVVAKEVSSGVGTQITEWEDLISWIEQYSDTQ